MVPAPPARVRSQAPRAVTWGMKLYTDDQPGVVSSSDLSLDSASRRPILLSVTDVCRVLQCGRTFVYELLRRGDLKAIKLGRLTRFSQEALAAFLDGREAEAAAERRHSRPVAPSVRPPLAIPRHRLATVSRTPPAATVSPAIQPHLI